jgi:hypothetical protein
MGHCGHDLGTAGAGYELTGEQRGFRRTSQQREQLVVPWGDGIQRRRAVSTAFQVSFHVLTGTVGQATDGEFPEDLGRRASLRPVGLRLTR